jgi:hypothetical protein
MGVVRKFVRMYLQNSGPYLPSLNSIFPLSRIDSIVIFRVRVIFSQTNKPLKPNLGQLHKKAVFCSPERFVA